jgi:hypothetical protein
VLSKELPPAPEATVKNIGTALMTKYVLPLEVIGLLLTVAMIGAVVIALREDAPQTTIETDGSKLAPAAAPSAILNSSSPSGGHS